MWAKEKSSAPLDKAAEAAEPPDKAAEAAEPPDKAAEPREGNDGEEKAADESVDATNTGAPIMNKWSPRHFDVMIKWGYETSQKTQIRYQMLRKYIWYSSY